MPECSDIRKTPSHPSGGEGGVSSGAAFRTPPSPCLGSASAFLLPLKRRGFGIASECDQYGAKHAVHVAHDIRVREAKHPIATIFQSSRSSQVVCFAFGMGVAVNFDDKAFAAGGKVRHVRSKDDLLLKFHAQAACAKMEPQALFGFGEVSAQFPGAISSFDVPLHTTAPSPRSAARSRPLPLKGERGSFVNA